MRRWCSLPINYVESFCYRYHTREEALLGHTFVVANLSIGLNGVALDDALGTYLAEMALKVKVDWRKKGKSNSLCFESITVE